MKRGLVTAGLILLGCAAPESDSGLRIGQATTEIAEAGHAETTAAAWFRDVAGEVGVDFRHRDARSGQRYYVETTASGGGWLDFDGDGDLDLYLVNGAPTPGSDLATPPRNALYENRGGRFIEVSAAAGVGDTGYGMGLCAADYDADGRLDFLVTNHGPDRLFRNLGAGRFEEVAARVGVAGERWGTNCAFGDLDGDGDLDLYVVNYVDFHFERNPRCGDAARGIGSYCRPDVFDGQVDYLYINQGPGPDGTVVFREEGGPRGIDQGSEEKGFGVLLSDLDDDGDADILVANDGTPNRLYENDGRGFFADRSLMSGLAVDRDGRAQSGMGLDLGDVDVDGRPDLLVTNYTFETNTLYLNRGGLFFEDRTAESGLGAPSYLTVGWGVQFFDFDNDTDLDVAVANGHVLDNAELFDPAVGYPQPNLLFENDGRGRFRDVSAAAGPAFAALRVSRALAAGDFNDDGRLDLLITNTNDRVDLLENVLDSGNHWIGFRLRGPPRNPAAIGARIVLRRGERHLGMREVRSGGSLMAQADLRLHFGLGESGGPVTAVIRWSDGHTARARFETVDAYHEVTYNPR